MKKRLIVATCAACGLFVTAISWNDSSRHYRAAGHIPSQPAYYKRPAQTNTSKAALKADIENLQRELNEIQAELPASNAEHAFNSKAPATKKQTLLKTKECARPHKK